MQMKIRHTKNLWGAVNAVLTGNVIEMQAYLRIQKSQKISYYMLRNQKMKNK